MKKQTENEPQSVPVGERIEEPGADPAAAAGARSPGLPVEQALTEAGYVAADMKWMMKESGVE